MRMLFVMDPLGSINIDKDTTFAFMLEAQRRGHGVYWCTVDALGASESDVWATADRVRLERTVGAHFETLGTERHSLADFGAVWMRKDPPVTLDYFYATHILDLADPQRTLVLNRPAGLRAANEKSFILGFGDVIPATIVTKSRDDILAFLDDHDGRSVIKPLDQMGGTGIFLLRRDDANLNSIIESSTEHERTYVTVQEFLPEAAEGDKRLILLDGEPLGAVLRVPARGEFRGNMAVGGKATASPITDRDREIVAAVSDRLSEHGLWFVGLDIIGGRLTEVNVTSPTGVQEVDRLHGLSVEQNVLDWVEAHVPPGASPG